VSTEQIEAILQAFDLPPTTFRQAEVEQALQLRDELTSRLLGILEEVCSVPEKYTERDTLLPSYAIELLAAFKEPRAHPLIIKAFSFPIGVVDQLWGDITTETLPVLLYKTCGGTMDALKELALDQGVDEYVRSAAIDALRLAVLDDAWERGEAVALFRELLDPERVDPDSPILETVLWSLEELFPDELLPILKKAYEDGLVDEDPVREWEHEFLRRDHGHILAMAKAAAEARLTRSIEDEMGWFACFRREERPSEEQRRREKARKKAKKRMAKKARKRNRR